MRFATLALIIVVCVGLVGGSIAHATTWWERDGGTTQEFRRELYECERDAAMMVPATPAPRSAPAPRNTIGYNMDAFYAGAHAEDLRHQREGWTRSCLHSKGWRLSR
jgi:hypothetical protein